MGVGLFLGLVLVGAIVMGIHIKEKGKKIRRGKERNINLCFFLLYVNCVFWPK